MSNWWEIVPAAEQFDIPSRKAVAYYRHSAQDRQENSIPIQQEQVQQWAEQIGIKIIHEFADAGKSGLNAEGRPAFTEMMEEWVKKRNDFMYVLCLDVSRWGRFQDIDLSAQYSAECKKHGKQVIYVTIGMPKEDDPLYPVYVQFERFRAAQYSRELSDKVWRGCVRIAQQGYWAGGSPPCGTKSSCRTTGFFTTARSTAASARSRARSPVRTGAAIGSSDSRPPPQRKERSDDQAQQPPPYPLRHLHAEEP
jgi:DNA invertase Pin-like site-specific DNA recombinase